MREKGAPSLSGSDDAPIEFVLRVLPLSFCFLLSPTPLTSSATFPASVGGACRVAESSDCCRETVKQAEARTKRRASKQKLDDACGSHRLPLLLPLLLRLVRAGSSRGISFEGV